MPKVGDKEFEYTPEGMKAAEQEAALTGQPVDKMKDYSDNMTPFDARDRKKIMPITNNMYSKA